MLYLEGSFIWQIVRAGKVKANVDHWDIIIGANLRAARYVKGDSQEQLASEIEVSHQQLDKYEKGVNRLSGTTLYEIAHILEFPIVFFYGGLEGDNLGLLDRDMAKEGEFFDMYQIFKKLENDKKRSSLERLVQNLIDN